MGAPKHVPPSSKWPPAFFFFSDRCQYRKEQHPDVQEQQHHHHHHIVTNSLIMFYPLSEIPRTIIFHPPIPNRRAVSACGKKACYVHIRRSRSAGRYHRHPAQCMLFVHTPPHARSNQKGFRLEVKSSMFSVIHQIKMPQPHILHMCYIVYNGMMWYAYLTHE